MTHWPIFVEFSVLALVIGVSGYFLSLYGDVIAEKTGLGGSWVGFALLATVTSLPELVTGVSAVTYVGAPNIALGDALGSCVFNLLLIVLLDFLHREASVYTRISQGHILSAGFGVVVLGFVAFNLVLYQNGVTLSFRHIGLYTPIILLFYIFADAHGFSLREIPAPGGRGRNRRALSENQFVQGADSSFLWPPSWWFWWVSGSR